jgi:hypothetical protein
MERESSYGALEYFKNSDGVFSVRCPMCGAIIHNDLPTFHAVIYKGFLHKKECKKAGHEVALEDQILSGPLTPSGLGALNVDCVHTGMEEAAGVGMPESSATCCELSTDSLLTAGYTVL